MNQHAAGEALAAQVAAAVRQVPGVAFLKPSLHGLLRASIRSVPLGSPGRPTEGVRLVRGPGPEPWAVSIHVVASRGHRALDVARAIREAATTALMVAFPDDKSQPVSVTVTISGIV
ncbi:hypothetical protein RVR_5861 [Actinacidiphila reveromycinica]|uniref:Asp23/Gls24 family envelope stress response protein n=1 Tax=Actinacidiphila reveromycinica TaxID=659352 RepID=A0A7U3VQ60_9ACTN|nr:hypothetical protein [Streptomyces sp. SN-593]BBA99304.1 hypothetical protein RVR_5861 [Streptomyces sp. SN-593]